MISRDLRHAQNVGARHRWLNRLQTALLVLTLLGLVGVEVTAGGIVPGDRVISIDGIAVDDVTTLQARLDDKNVGDVVVLLVERAGKTREMLVELQPGV
ncbi:PDZ domain-containing protein [Pseudomonas sp. WS 5111]|jgi:S1-C subfamily serine protease|nr:MULTISPECIES: PDZ domain-containing protein [Pseudomonas]MDW8844249.1 PDZ domain-containing protein [Pseudomonas carnis]NMX67253.1 PDZ domain-containing protein [Pseudomonas sp. WS 5111]NMX83427.1 PDZ domain-containing protein [Pseudomonas sp. WS 5503]NMZ18858.1 PDZ domain-containing protein [Pseudomonas rhodesiae]NNA12863.1 PDZ domain-containing protein [Pseudomonas lundensis]